MPRKLVLKGYGTIMITPVNIEEKEYESVDPTGQPLIKETTGTRASTIYKTSDGVVVPTTKICKKINVEGEDIIVPKFKCTKEIEFEEIEVVDSLSYSPIERKGWSVVTDDQNIKNLILIQNKVLRYPYTAGNGWKLWDSFLTSRKGKLVMIGLRGDFDATLDKFDEQTVDLEFDPMPQVKDKKKLLKAMIM